MWPKEPNYSPEKEGSCLWLCPPVQHTRHGRTEQHETADSERSCTSNTAWWGPSAQGKPSPGPTADLPAGGGAKAHPHLAQVKLPTPSLSKGEQGHKSGAAGGSPTDVCGAPGYTPCCGLPARRETTACTKTPRNAEQGILIPSLSSELRAPLATLTCKTHLVLFLPRFRLPTA